MRPISHDDCDHETRIAIHMIRPTVQPQHDYQITQMLEEFAADLAFTNMDKYILFFI